MLFAFSIVCTFAVLVQKKLVGKTAGTLTGVKRVAQSCASNHCIPHLHALSVFFKPLFINFIKLYPMNTCLFSILCDKTGSMHKALLLHVEA